MIDESTGEILFGNDRETPNNIFLRSSYNYDMDYSSDRYALRCKDPTRAQQQFKEECDINTIVKRFGITGKLPENVKMPLQGDFAEVRDYQDALNKMIEADEAFMKMPAEVRERFQNDPGKFVDYVSNEENVEDARKWGLAHAKKAEPEIPFVRIYSEEKPPK